MLDNLQAYKQLEHVKTEHVVSQLRGMETGGMLSGSLYFHVLTISRCPGVLS